LKKQWCIPSVGAEFVWRMEDILDLYEEPYDEKRPVVCFDEMPYQMVQEKHTPLAAQPSKPGRYDYEYKRMGTANLFVVLEPKKGWRHVEVTQRRTALDFASQMRKLTEEHYAQAEKIRVVMDNLKAPTRPLRSTRRLRPKKPGASWAAWSSTTLPTTPAVAKPGGDRAFGAAKAMSGRETHPGQREPQEGSGGVGAGMQRGWGEGAVAVYSGGCSGEAGASLPSKTIVVRY
jgi:hypothetical protein